MLALRSSFPIARYGRARFSCAVRYCLVAPCLSPIVIVRTFSFSHTL
jgi:hypothetical protein